MPVLLVRHGESEGNAARIVQGQSEFPLTERGRVEALAVARRLAALPVARLYSSPIGRAWSTAEAIGGAVALAPERLDGMREYGYGAAEGLPWREITQRWAVDGAEFGVGPIPGEEGVEPFRARIERALRGLLEAHREDLAVCVTHGGTIGQAVSWALGLPAPVRPRIYVGNTSVTELTGDVDAPVVVALNDRCHLRELSA